MGSLRSGATLATRLLDRFGRLARRGECATAAPRGRRRLLLVQIDGLSSRLLEQAIARGHMPHLARRIASGQLRLRKLLTLHAPSTPVFQAGLLYGDTAGIPGFGWYDRRLGRVVRMDLAEDVEAVQGELDRRGRGLLEGGVSYGTIFTGRALDAFFNVVRWGRPGATPAERRPSPERNRWDHLASLTMGAVIAARLVGPLGAELGAALWDLGRFLRRERTTRFEWRFLYMRLFTAVVLRETETFGLLLDVLRGVPVLYADYFGYDEYAHRRGPDSRLALWNLRAIDEDLERLLGAVARVPDPGYDVFVFSDHGQSACRPFERVVGEPLDALVLSLAAERDGGAPAAVHADALRGLVELRSLRFWARTRWPLVRACIDPYLAWLERHAEAELRRASRLPLHRVRVVTGGSIAHVYVGDGEAPATADAIAARWPRLVDGLARSLGVGLMVARGAHGPLLWYRGRRYHLADRRRLATLPPFRRLGYPVLAAQLAGAVASERSGDLVLFGAFAPGGDTSFDFELGAHGGVHPDELDHFLLHPPSVEVPFGETGGGEALHRFFRARYLDEGEPAGAAEPCRGCGS
jgi:hypothetical protein